MTTPCHVYKACVILLKHKKINAIQEILSYFYVDMKIQNFLICKNLTILNSSTSKCLSLVNKMSTSFPFWLFEATHLIDFLDSSKLPEKNWSESDHFQTLLKYVWSFCYHIAGNSSLLTEKNQKSRFQNVNGANTLFTTDRESLLGTLVGKRILFNLKI